MVEQIQTDLHGMAGNRKTGIIHRVMALEGQVSDCVEHIEESDKERRARIGILLGSIASAAVAVISVVASWVLSRFNGPSGGGVVP